jgi:hypothetical protein
MYCTLRMMKADAKSKVDDQNRKSANQKLP